MGIDHNGGRRVAYRGPVAWAGGVVCELVVYMTEKWGRGAAALTSTKRICSGGRVSKLVTASLAVASARPSPRTWVLALLFLRVVEQPFSRQVSKRSEDFLSWSMWWW